MLTCAQLKHISVCINFVTGELKRQMISVFRLIFMPTRICCQKNTYQSWKEIIIEILLIKLISQKLSCTPKSDLDLYPTDLTKNRRPWIVIYNFFSHWTETLHFSKVTMISTLILVTPNAKKFCLTSCHFIEYDIALKYYIDIFEFW